MFRLDQETESFCLFSLHLSIPSTFLTKWDTPLRTWRAVSGFHWTLVFPEDSNWFKLPKNVIISGKKNPNYCIVSNWKLLKINAFWGLNCPGREEESSDFAAFPPWAAKDRIPLVCPERPGSVGQRGMASSLQPCPRVLQSPDLHRNVRRNS